VGSGTGGPGTWISGSFGGLQFDVPPLLMVGLWPRIRRFPEDRRVSIAGQSNPCNLAVDPSAKCYSYTLTHLFTATILVTGTSTVLVYGRYT
jgi:hypothetical protein